MFTVFIDFIVCHPSCFLLANLVNWLFFRYSFMSIILPCVDIKLRAQVTQRPSRKTPRYENMDNLVEKELAILLAKEIDFELRLE